MLPPKVAVPLATPAVSVDESALLLRIVPARPSSRRRSGCSLPESSVPALTVRLPVLAPRAQALPSCSTPPLTVVAADVAIGGAEGQRAVAGLGQAAALEGAQHDGRAEGHVVAARVEGGDRRRHRSSVCWKPKCPGVLPVSQVRVALPAKSASRLGAALPPAPEPRPPLTKLTVPGRERHARKGEPPVGLSRRSRDWTGPACRGPSC